MSQDPKPKIEDMIKRIFPPEKMDLFELRRAYVNPTEKRYLIFPIKTNKTNKANKTNKKKKSKGD